MCVIFLLIKYYAFINKINKIEKIILLFSFYIHLINGCSTNRKTI